MKLKHKSGYLLVLAVILSILLIAVPVSADFGSYSGSSDYGGSSSYSGGGYSGGYDYDDDDDYYYSGSSSGGSGGGGDAGTLIASAVIVGICLIYSVIKGKSKKRKHGNKGNKFGTMPAGATPTAASALTSIDKFKSFDPNFDENELCEKISNLYVQMQNGWTDGDISSLRPYFTDAFFTQMERQLNQLKAANRTNYVEQIAVLNVNLKGFTKVGDEDRIIAEVRTRIVDYTVDNNSGKVISGDRDKEKFMTYEYTLTREHGVVTDVSDGTRKITCPGCGAPLDINSSARCPYCDTVLESDAHDWAICAIKGISQRTGR